MRVIPLIWTLLLLVLPALWLPASAQTTIQLFDEDAEVELSGNFAFYAEPDGPLTHQ